MAELQIRCYEDGDLKAVREIFALGLRGLLGSFCLHVLKQLQVQMLLLCVFCALLAGSGSVLLPALALALLLVAGRQGIRHIIESYIEKSLRDDLTNIRQTYLDKPNSCFWVAESRGRVVGTVACRPMEMNGGSVELRRVSVRLSHRGQGIGKALCQAVEDFARRQGLPAVVLYTSVVQTDAQKLFERMGFKKIREFASAELYSGITKFTVIKYMLDLQQPGN